ncbi:Imm1 family immunity protein [Saccharopolyspora sp. NPDC000995]
MKRTEPRPRACGGVRHGRAGCFVVLGRGNTAALQPRQRSRGRGLGRREHCAPADAWVPRNVVDRALEEFLRTAQRPRAVKWQPDPFPLRGL